MNPHHRCELSGRLWTDRRSRHPACLPVKITAVDFRNVLDGGAYTSFGVITAYYAGFMIPTLYHIPNYRYHGRRMYTNKPPCGAMRGHGVPQPRFAIESLLDMLAEQIGMDPIDIRMVNAMDPNTRTVNISARREEVGKVT